MQLSCGLLLRCFLEYFCGFRKCFSLSKEEKISALVRELLKVLGEDVIREGLENTPRRVAKFFSGFSPQSKIESVELLENYVKLFYEPSLLNSNQVVTVESIPFCSLCEHHLLPFFGTVDVSYIPKDGKILGLSKFSRIIEYFSKKLQMQERLTEQIADFLFGNVPSKWLKVTINATHICVIARGIKSVGSETKTEVVKGNM